MHVVAQRLGRWSADCFDLSLLISAEFTLEMWATAKNCKNTQNLF